MSMAEWNAFLANETKNYQKGLTDELVAETLRCDMDNALAICDVETAFRFDDRTRETLALTVDADTRERLYDDGVQLKRIFLNVYAYRRSPDRIDPVSTKKAIEAELYVYAGYKAESPWLQIADQLLPEVSGIDFDSVDDIAVVGVALANKESRERKKQLFNDIVIESLRRLIDDNEGDEVETSGYVLALNRCAGMYIMNEFHRAAAIDETVRDTGLPRQSIDTLRSAYDNYYNSTGGYFPVSLL